MRNKRFLRITGEIIKETFYMFCDLVTNNLRNVSILLRVGLPYIMWYLGIYLYIQRGKFTVGGEIFIPLIVFIFTGYIRGYANKIGKGERIPTPEKRFTQEGLEDGEVTIESDRLEELILYMSNLEDYLQRHGLLK